MIQKSFLCFLSQLLLVCGTFVLTAEAERLSTAVVLQSTEHDTAKTRILSLLEREDLLKGLSAFGVSAAETRARVAALSARELEQLAANIDSIEAGGDGLGTVVTALVVIFLVLLLTDIIGWTRVYPFTRPIR